MKLLIHQYKEKIPFVAREHLGVVLTILGLFLFNIVILFDWLPIWLLNLSEVINEVLSFSFLLLVILKVAFSIDKQSKYNKGFLENEVRIKVVTDKDENTELILVLTLFFILVVFLLFVLINKLWIFSDIVYYLGFVVLVLFGYFTIQYLLEKIFEMPKGFISIWDNKVNMIGMKNRGLDVESIHSIKITNEQIIIESPETFFYKTPKLLLTKEKIDKIVELIQSSESTKNIIVNIDLG